MFSKVIFASLMIGALSVNALVTTGSDSSSDSTWLKREPHREGPYRGRPKTLQSRPKRGSDSDIDRTWERREPIAPVPKYTLHRTQVGPPPVPVKTRLPAKPKREPIVDAPKYRPRPTRAVPPPVSFQTRLPVKPKREPLMAFPTYALHPARVGPPPVSVPIRLPVAKPKREPLRAYFPTHNPWLPVRPKREPYPEPDLDEAYAFSEREPELEPWVEDMEELY